jgi:peptidyl-prolyl cis-trans isomerase B (cyclophilin B)
MSLRLLAPAFALLAVTLTGCGDTGSDTASDSPSTSSAGSTPATGTTCSYPSSPPAAKEVSPPPEVPTVTGEVEVTIATSQGDLHATLDADAAPCTVNSFVSLADQGYFDGTACHRITTEGIYVLQCGDPSGTGGGGPGYSFADELSGTEQYPAGTLAMANAGPDTNGSQFFVVYDDSPLGPNYTVFGTVDAASVTTIKDVAKAGTDNAYGAGDGRPTSEVVIDYVTTG